MTAVHALVVTLLSAWCGFVQGPWPFTHAGGPSTPLQLVTTEICLGYFLFDFTWCLYFRSEGPVMLLHHVVSIFGLTFSAITGHYGTELIASIFGSEATNPLLQMRWFLKESGKYDTLLGEIVDHAFVFSFGFLRIGVGSLLLYFYFQQDTDILGRISGVVLYSISWMFWVSIVQYAIHKYQKKFKRWAEIAESKKNESKSKKLNGHNGTTNGSLHNNVANDSLSFKPVSQINGDLNSNTRSQELSSKTVAIEETTNTENGGKLNGDLHKRKPISAE